jgi:hypothetical protein
MTSRMLFAPAMSMTRRSRPKASPPSGGQPCLRASSRKPNVSFGFFAPDAEQVEHGLL